MQADSSINFYFSSQEIRNPNRISLYSSNSTYHSNWETNEWKIYE